ncbi:hypothetical protein [Vibrio splendidus]|uniref:capsular polysaccharide export protein, LipB/KpsS family n=1 Tax=Vibrio splendidus TaxID=29497 RepID=UPI0013B3DF82|nr:hypothetical protein [Vibrio splendidus]
MAAFVPEVEGGYSLENDLGLVEKLMSFNKKSYELYDRTEDTKLKKVAIKYLNYFDYLFKHENFDFLIVSGESRLIPSIIIHLAKFYGVKIIYFEQGPFGKTIIDYKGVNANISFCPSFKPLNKDKYKSLFNFINDFENKNEKFWSVEKLGIVDKVYRFFTVLLMFQPRLLTFILPSDLGLGQYLFKGYIEPKFKRLSIKNKKKSESEKHAEVEHNIEPYIGLYLQVPVDAQLIEHSPHYKCFYEMVSDVIKVKPNGYSLYIREHPQYLGKYDRRIYDLVSKHDDVLLQNDVDLNRMINGSSCSILNNSAVGIESLLLGVNVVCLGEAYYSHRGITYDYNGELESLKDNIISAVENKLEKEKVESFMYEFVFDYLQNGHFQDLKLQYPNINLI